MNFVLAVVKMGKFVTEKMFAFEEREREELHQRV
jgi:hypothetical protein